MISSTNVALFGRDWDGVNAYEKERATMLAELGYVAFAADIFGADLQEDLSFDQRVNLTTLYRSDPELFVERITSAIEQLKMVEDVDPNNIGALGYCFGGTGMIDLAFAGNNETKIVTAFHGGLTPLPNVTVPISPYTLM